MTVQLDSGIPVANGILTTENETQALARIEQLAAGVPSGCATAVPGLLLPDVHHGAVAMGQQFFLAGVVKVERALGNTGMRGHFFGPGGGEALFDEQRQRSVQQLLRSDVFQALSGGAGDGVHSY